jgi:hypothetical protein
VCEDPISHLADWLVLYDGLIDRHRITGMRRFSPRAFEKMLRLPGLVMLMATVEGELAGLHTWVVQDDRAYGHLGATNQLGYRFLAAYALYWYALQVFRDRVAWLDLGAAPDASGGQSGLYRFKQRWATGVRPTYFCSSVFDPAKYEALVSASGTGNAEFFPAYREGEFR